MFADYLHSEVFGAKLSKIATSFSTRQNPTFVINLTKIGSPLSPEEHRLHAWAGPRLAEFTK
jgi:hypothetical protein